MNYLIERAADEIGRLDQIAVGSAFAADLFLRTEALVRLVGLGDGDRPVDDDTCRRTMLAAEVDPYHEMSLTDGARRWMGFLREEVRRARGGGLPALDRWSDISPTLATYSHGAALENAWRDGAGGMPLLGGAVAAAAWAPDVATGEALATVLLVARGRSADLRLLPFGDIPASTRTEAVHAWRAGESGSWTVLALETIARNARRLRLRIAAIGAAGDGEWLRLEALGRRGHTARRALPLLRTQGALTMPILAEDLGISRPAATETLRVLADAGCAIELTGRARDRVWGYAPIVIAPR